VLAALVLREILPLGLPGPDVPEAAKELAARRHLPYDSRSITNAIASAQAQAKKQGSLARSP